MGKIYSRNETKIKKCQRVIIDKLDNLSDSNQINLNMQYLTRRPADVPEQNVMLDELHKVNIMLTKINDRIRNNLLIKPVNMLPEYMSLPKVVLI